uniref:Transposase n=1 Tax=Panagrellus redivivus TaxID=6233 RepID=A0A7E4VIA6_PANRE
MREVLLIHRGKQLRENRGNADFVNPRRAKIEVMLSKPSKTLFPKRMTDQWSLNACKWNDRQRRFGLVAMAPEVGQIRGLVSVFSV